MEYRWLLRGQPSPERACQCGRREKGCPLNFCVNNSAVLCNLGCWVRCIRGHFYVSLTSGFCNFNFLQTISAVVSSDTVITLASSSREFLSCSADLL